MDSTEDNLMSSINESQNQEIAEKLVEENQENKGNTDSVKEKENIETDNGNVCSPMMEESESNKTEESPQIIEDVKPSEDLVSPGIIEESKTLEANKSPQVIKETEANEASVSPQAMEEEAETNEANESPQAIKETEANDASASFQAMEETEAEEVNAISQVMEETEGNEANVNPMKETEANEANACSEIKDDLKTNEEVSKEEKENISTSEEVKKSEEVVHSNEDKTFDNSTDPTEDPKISPDFIENRCSSPKMNESQGITESLSHEAMDHSSIEAKDTEITVESETSNTGLNLESSSQILNENVCLKEKELTELLEVDNSLQSTINSSITTDNNNSLPNSSLKLLAEYNSESEKEENDEDNDVMEVPLDSNTDYRNAIVEIKSESESETSSDDLDTEYLNKIRKEIQSTIDLADEDDEDDDDDAMSVGSRRKKQNNMRVKGELMLEDLPPIQDLHITVPEKECVELGQVHSIIDQLLLVSVLPNSLLLDLETVLFLDKGQKVLGAVFDVLGQVADPLYCIRFNKHEEIEEKNIKIGDTVYVAPKTEYTQFVILSNLMKLRGSDASWENDVEPPPRYLDYSDDEQEREARTRLRNKDRPNDHQDPVKRSRDNENDDLIITPSSSTYSGVPRQRVPPFEGRHNRNRGNMSRQPQQYRQNQQNQPQNNSGSWHSNYQRSFPQQHNVIRQMPPSYSSNAPLPTYAMYPSYPGYINHPPPPPSAQPQMFVLNPLAVVPPRMFTHLLPPKLSPHSPPPSPPGMD